MELLERLTRRQVDALRVVGAEGTAGKGVSLKRVAESLNVRPPSALTYLTSLEQAGLVIRHRGKTRLSQRGRSTLDEYHRHHRVAETMFSKLGLSPEDTCKAALEVDLAISHKTIVRVCAAEGHPTQCPHGEPISPCSPNQVSG